MSLAFDIYYRCPVWLQNMLVSGQGLRLRRLRYGGLHDHRLTALLRSQWLGPEQIQALQLTLLSGTLRHARETVPLYQERGLPAQELRDFEELRAVAILRKDDLRAPFHQIVSRNYHSQRLSEVHTGGTTGKPLTIYCDRRTLQHNFAFFSRLRAWAGIEPGARTATFAGRTIVAPAQQRPPYWRKNAASNAMLFSSYHLSPDTLPDYVRGLTDFAPALIDSYPSSIEPIARYLRDQRITSIRPRAIVTSSETLYPAVRTLIQEAFACPVFDYYGAAEMAALVTQCEAGSYHVNPEFGFLELLQNGEPVRAGESGEIIATGFLNPVMPLIRYATGDIASWKAGDCSCGRSFPRLEQIEGRKDDVIITPEGRRVGRLDPIFKAVSSIHEAQIVQQRLDHIEVQLVGDSIPPGEEAALRDELRRRLGSSMRIDLVLVPRIERSTAGKLRTVVNRMGSRSESDSQPNDGTVS
ncbi:MAG: phenylacetate--CoA ligase family protein [Longimicrobiales bacterium]